MTWRGSGRGSRQREKSRFISTRPGSLRQAQDKCQIQAMPAGFGNPAGAIKSDHPLPLPNPRYRPLQGARVQAELKSVLAWSHDQIVAELARSSTLSLGQSTKGWTKYRVRAVRLRPPASDVADAHISPSPTECGGSNPAFLIKAGLDSGRYVHEFHSAASRRNQIFGHGFTQIFTDFHRFLFLFHLCLSVQSVS